MLSRVAECVFWMARYVERAENVARFIDVNQNLSLDLGASVGEQWAPLVYTAGDWAAFQERKQPATRENVLHFLMFDRNNSNSIWSCLHRARENARAVREVISSAMWEEINKFYLLVREAAGDEDLLAQPYDFYAQVKRASHLHVGITEATMSHGEAWHFARLGRLLERADKTSRLVDVKYFILLPTVRLVSSPLDVVQWSALLKSASALEMYRRAHGRITPTKVADFLVLDCQFPRSMRFCLMQAEQSLREITGNTGGGFRGKAEQRLGRLRADLVYATIEDIIDRGMHEFIDEFQTRLNQVGAAIHENFFAARATPTRPPSQSQRQTVR
jgi:uncharacterized alpha-E superfamily protein